MRTTILGLSALALLAFGCGSDESTFFWNAGSPNPGPTTSLTPTPTPTNGVVLESLDSSQSVGTANSGTPAISGNGGLVIFDSFSFVSSGTLSDSYVRNRATQTLQLASSNAAGVRGNGASGGSRISSDGRFAVFQSNGSSNLVVPSSTLVEAYRKDLVSSHVILLSLNTAGNFANDSIFDCAISSDANLVGYASLATNLSTPPGNGQRHIYLRNVTTGTTRLVSTDAAAAQGNGQSGGCWLSGDGAFIAFYSDATNLVAGDTNGVTDVFLKNLNTGAILRVSVDSSGAQANGQSPLFNVGTDSLSVNSNGRFVVFSSLATNLVAGDTNGVSDVFLRDALNNTTRRLSISTAGVQGNGISDSPMISDDGKFVVFQSDSTNLDGITTARNVYVYNTQSNVCKRVVFALDGVSEPNGFCAAPRISADGSRICFSSNATNLVTQNTNNQQQVYSIANPLFP